MQDNAYQLHVKEEMLMYYKLNDLSRLSGIPYITLYREIKDKKLNAVKIRNALYVYEIDWKEYVVKNNLSAKGFDYQKLVNALKEMDNEQLSKASSLITQDITNIIRNVNNLKTGEPLNKILTDDIDEFLKIVKGK